MGGPARRPPPPPPGSPTRFYFPSSGAAPVAPAYSSTWHRTVGAFRTNLVRIPTQTATAERPVSHTTALAPEWHLMGQFISEPLAAQTIRGTVKGQVRGRNNSETYQGTLALRAFVVSGDGTVVRGVLVDNTASTLATVPPVFQGSSDLSRNRAFLTAADAAVIPVTPLTIQDGDRLVVGVLSASVRRGSEAGA